MKLEVFQLLTRPTVFRVTIYNGYVMNFLISNSAKINSSIFLMLFGRWSLVVVLIAHCSIPVVSDAPIQHKRIISDHRFQLNSSRFVFSFDNAT